VAKYWAKNPHIIFFLAILQLPHSEHLGKNGKGRSSDTFLPLDESEIVGWVDWGL
jgi:hypothetical protein